MAAANVYLLLFIMFHNMYSLLSYKFLEKDIKISISVLIIFIMYNNIYSGYWKIKRLFKILHDQRNQF